MSNNECSRKVLSSAVAATALAAFAPFAYSQVTTPAYPQAPAYPQQQSATPQSPAYPQQQPAYPQQPAYAPQPAYPPQAGATDPQMAMQMQSDKPHPIRALFAGTIATLLQVSGAGIATGLTQSVAGGLTNWFARKNQTGQYAQQPYVQGYPSATSAYPSAAQGYSAASPYASTSPTYPSTQPSAYGATTPAYSTTAAYPATSAAYPASSPTYPTTSPAYATTATSADPYASTTAGAAYPAQATAYPAPTTSPYPGVTAPGTSAYATPTQYGAQTASTYPSTGTQVYDAQTGQISTAAGTVYATSSAATDGTLYAGIAYEVHALGPGGTTTPVNPATYVFRTGDRFMVYYRPSMPGRMDVFNINPAGRQTQIDSASMAAGQMASLGPYEFSAMTGDESLRISLSPCSTQQLLVATRDIVNVASPTTATSGVQLGTCGTGTRGLDVKTRDITKVAVDGGTAFALDPVSVRELSGGQIATRDVQIVFHHR